MKESRLQAALAFMSDPAQLQQLAFGDHKLKLEDGTEIVVGAALLKTCVAEMYRDYCASCKVHDEAPLDEKNFRDLSCAVANGKTTRLGALDPVACQTERNFKRCRSYCDEVVGRGDRMKLGAHAALQGLNIARCASTPCEPCSVADAATFKFTLVTGQVVSPSPPPAGWACIKNLPQTTPSARSYEFALWAARLKLRGKALKNKEAYHEQRRVGTAAFAVDWPDDNYVRSMATTDGSPALCRMEHLEHAALKALLTKGEPYIKRQLESAKAREAKAAAKVAKPKARTSPAGGAALGAVGGASGGVAPAAKRSRDPLSVVVVQPISGSTSLTSIVKALEGGALGAAKLKHLESQWPTAGHLADVAGDTHALQVGYDAIKAALALAEARGCVPPVSSIQALAQALREHLHGGGGGGAAAAAVSAASGAGVANAPGGDTAEDPAVRAEPPPTRQTRAQRDYHDYDDDDDDEGSEIDDESEDRLLSMLYEYADDDDGEEEEEEEVDDDEEEGEVEGWD